MEVDYSFMVDEKLLKCEKFVKVYNEIFVW